MEVRARPDKQGGRLSRRARGPWLRHRDAAAAERHAGGAGHLLVGAEPASLQGVTPLDPGDLGNGLRPYLGTRGPLWSGHYVEVDRIRVLSVTVEPARWRDPIHLLRKTNQENPKPQDGADDGGVFVRRAASTPRANAAEIDLLAERLSR